MSCITDAAVEQVLLIMLIHLQMYLLAMLEVCDGIDRAVGGAPSDIETFYSAPQFPESSSPAHGGRQAALPNFLRESTATRMGPSFFLTSHLLSLDYPSCARHSHFTRAFLSRYADLLSQTWEQIV